MKKLLPVIIFLLFPVTVYAAGFGLGLTEMGPRLADGAYTSGVWEYSVSNGEVQIDLYTGSAVNLTVPAMFENTPVVSIGADVFMASAPFVENTTLETVVIPRSVKVIGQSAFYGCTNLRTINMPDGIVNIAGAAFGGCTSLQNLTFPNTIEYLFGFQDCTSLTSVTIPPHCKIVDFDRCTGLTEITLTLGLRTENPIFNGTQGYEGIHNVGLDFGDFSGCTNLRTIIIPEGIQEIGDSSFKGCTALETITFPSTIWGIDDAAFSNCPNLKTVYFYGEKPTYIGFTGIFQIYGDIMGEQGIIKEHPDNFTVYHLSGASGWANPWEDTNYYGHYSYTTGIFTP